MQIMKKSVCMLVYICVTNVGSEAYAELTVKQPRIQKNKPP